MRQHIQKLITDAVTTLIEGGELNIEAAPPVQLDVPRDPAHGDFSTNVAMVLAKPCRLPPRQLAERIVASVPANELPGSISVAGPGFINITLHADAFMSAVGEIIALGERYGCSNAGAGKRVQIEFVSANPTGPLHIGHGRGAAYGAVIANLLAAVGYDVCREYYVNDAGRQMDILALSVWLRYLQALGHDIEFPANAYLGDYVTDMAVALRAAHGDEFSVSPGRIPREDDPERLLDAWIARCREVLAADRYARVLASARDFVLAWIRRDLSEFGVEYDSWYSERSLIDAGLIERVLEGLRGDRFVYQKDGAEWFRSTAFGDEKDRVVVRDNGSPTYFASDIAYHADKYARGFEHLINVWGADHHGYVARLAAAITALGKDPLCLEILLVQFASLYRDGQKVQMSTRSGQFVTLKELLDDVGCDAARFFYVTRRADQHLDFDLDLAKTQSSENPVYYIQYAHARICSVFRQLEHKALTFTTARGLEVLDRLGEGQERALASLLSRYPDIVESAASAREPHQLATYLRELANEFHGYYNTHKLIVDDADLRDARLALAVAIKTVIGNGLKLLGVSAPAEM